MVYKECLIKVTLNNKLLQFEKNVSFLGEKKCKFGNSYTIQFLQKCNEFRDFNFCEWAFNASYWISAPDIILSVNNTNPIIVYFENLNWIINNIKSNDIMFCITYMNISDFEWFIKRR